MRIGLAKPDKVFALGRPTNERLEFAPSSTPAASPTLPLFPGRPGSGSAVLAARFLLETRGPNLTSTRAHRLAVSAKAETATTAGGREPGPRSLNAFLNANLNAEEPGLARLGNAAAAAAVL